MAPAEIIDLTMDEDAIDESKSHSGGVCASNTSTSSVERKISVAMVKNEAKCGEVAESKPKVSESAERSKAGLPVSNADLQKQIARQIERLLAQAFLSKDATFTRKRCRMKLKEVFGDSEIDSRHEFVTERINETIVRVCSLPTSDLQNLASDELLVSNIEAKPGTKTSEPKLPTASMGCDGPVTGLDDLENGDDGSSDEDPSDISSWHNPLQNFDFSVYARIQRKKRGRKNRKISRDLRGGAAADDPDAQNSNADVLDDDVGLSHSDAQAQTFITYVPPTCCHSSLKAHPDELVETASLASVPEPVVVSKLRLPSRTLLDGLLTNAQLEVCLRATAQHELRLPNGQRSGFFMGDGAGVGKGRQQAGIIFHNFLHGRNRALWMSVSPDLIEDSRRDIRDIGAGSFIPCHDLKSYKITQDLRGVAILEKGIMFCTYSLLVSGTARQSRLEQIIEWCGPEFDGILTLDECHRAKNLSKAGASKAALAVRQLQDRLPLARVVYVSATGATEPEHLACLSRLGLWGEDTAFSSVENFIDDIKKGGVGAMELCAMHMKASGQYLARSLSFTGASFEVVREDLPPDFARMYDASANLWMKIVKAVYSESDSSAPVMDRKALKSQLWGVHQRFWAQICMNAKVDLTVRTANEALREGKCVVIGLQNTGESVAGEDETSEEPSSTAEGVLKAFLTRHCEGLPYPIRQELLQELKTIKLPNNPLDEIIHQLGGPSNVAEMTGRKSRYVCRNGIWAYVPRVKEKGSSDAINIAERKHFQSGQKLIAIISEAASTGISLQADRRVANQRRRVHITFQLPWSAEKAVQQMGRSHRSNQASAPEFKLILSPLGGEWRFASAVANRLQSLGALTQGDRRAAGASAAMRTFTIEPKYGLKALDQLQNYIFCGDNLAHTVPDFITSSYGSASHFRIEAKKAMDAAGLNPKLTGQGCKLKRFLNRIFGLPLQFQTHVFDLFSYLLEAEVTSAKASNKYSEGIVDICGQTEVVCERDLYKCPKTGAIARYYKISTDRGVSWQEASSLHSEQVDGNAGFYRATYKSAANKEIFVLALQKRTLASAASINYNYYHLVRPNTGYSPVETHRSDLLKNYSKVTPDKAKAAWEALYKSSENRCGHIDRKHCSGPSCTYQRRLHHYHIVAGLVLPFWKDIASINENMKVVRVSVNGKRIVGLNIFPNAIQRVNEIIEQGIAASDHIEERLGNMPPAPFLEAVREPLIMHDCLSTTGVENLSFRNMLLSDPEIFVYARCFEIPLSNAARTAKQRLKEVPWEQGPQIFVNDVQIPVPAGKGKMICPLIINRNLWEGQEYNRLRAVSKGARFCLVVQAGKKKSIIEVIKQVQSVGQIPASSSRALLAELKRNSESDGIQIVSADTIPLRCPLGFTRIQVPVRGISCRHLQCFDLNNFLSFAERSSRWACPVCEKILCLEDLRVDALSVEALKQEHVADSFIVNIDGSLGNGKERPCTPPTARKISGRDEIDPVPLFPASDFLQGDFMQNDMPDGLAEIFKCGVWEYDELAESAFALPLASPDCSDAEVNDEHAAANCEAKGPDFQALAAPSPKSRVNVSAEASPQTRSTDKSLKKEGADELRRRAVRRGAVKVSYAESSDDSDGGVDDDDGDFGAESPSGGEKGLAFEESDEGDDESMDEEAGDDSDCCWRKGTPASRRQRRGGAALSSRRAMPRGGGGGKRPRKDDCSD